MNKIYRRQKKGKEHNFVRKNSSFKELLIKQAMISGIILALLCSVSVSSDESYIFPKKAVKFILSNSTDIKQIPSKVKKIINSEKTETKREEIDKKSALLNMVKPAEGTMESPFGERIHPTENISKFHYGVDLAMPCGTKVLAAQKGVVKEALENGDYGKYIVVDHGDGIITLYAHLSNVLAQQGDEVDAGQMIAESGDSGNVTGPHLHFEIKDGEEWLNPADFIDFDKNEGE